MQPSAVIFGCSGLDLTPQERDFFHQANPWAFILFSRNVDTPQQVDDLCTQLRMAVGRDCLIFVDQEGGRVQRLKRPHWRAYPSGARLAALYDDDPIYARRAAFLSYRLIAQDLREVGINANCAPVLDIPQIGADPIISDRALGTSAAQIIDMAHAAMAGMMMGGVVPVIKHIPGHGRATVDSHLALPKIDTDYEILKQSDFLPFSAFSQGSLCRNTLPQNPISMAPMAMTAHAVFSAVSDHAVTICPNAFSQIIRRDIGYQGLVMSDDLDMKALSGTLKDRTARALAAGCDIALHCSGQMQAMEQVMEGAKILSADSLKRAKIAQNCADITPNSPADFDKEAAHRELSTLLDRVASVDIARAPLSIVEST